MVCNTVNPYSQNISSGTEYNFWNNLWDHTRERQERDQYPHDELLKPKVSAETERFV